jgi:hypothetical protein
MSKEIQMAQTMKKKIFKAALKYAHKGVYPQEWDSSLRPDQSGHLTDFIQGAKWMFELLTKDI